MKKKRISLLTMFIAINLFILTGGNISLASDIEVPVTVTISSSIVETPTALDFGTLDVGSINTGITATIDASSGAQSGSGSASGMTISGGSAIQSGSWHSGSITVTSSTGVDFTINIDWSAVTGSISLTGGSGTVTLSDIPAHSTSGSLSHTGGTPTVINVGGTLNIGADAATPGTSETYTGTITVTLNYS